MKNILQFASLIVCILCFGCASNPPQSKFGAETVSQVKQGMSKTEITTMLGEPRSRTVESDGTESWQYRKNAQEGKGLKTYMDIASFGLTSGHDAEYMDVLNVYFKDGVVLKTSYQENAHILGLGK